MASILGSLWGLERHQGAKSDPETPKEHPGEIPTPFCHLPTSKKPLLFQTFRLKTQKRGPKTEYNKNSEKERNMEPLDHKNRCSRLRRGANSRKSNVSKNVSILGPFWSRFGEPKSLLYYFLACLFFDCFLRSKNRGPTDNLGAARALRGCIIKRFNH